MSHPDRIDAVTGHVRMMLRGEGLAVFAAATGLYFFSGGVWWVFAVLLFVPDLSFAGYAAGNKVGAVIYNIAHTSIVPLAFGALGVLMQAEWIQHVALIHLAHIGLDRSLGYGLKYASGFKHTHLGDLGRG